jgi:hypothetical protein
MNGLEVFEKGYIARLTILTDPMAIRRQVLEHSARTAVTAVASMLAARVLKLPQTYWAPITTMVITQSSLGATLAVSWQRFIGTAVGAALGALVASHFGTYTLVFAASVSFWEYFAQDCEWIEAHIGSGALRWRSFCSFDEWSLRGKLPFIDSPKYRPELQWRW